MARYSPGAGGDPPVATGLGGLAQEPRKGPRTFAEASNLFSFTLHPEGYNQPTTLAAVDGSAPQPSPASPLPQGVGR